MYTEMQHDTYTVWFVNTLQNITMSCNIFVCGQLKLKTLYRSIVNLSYLSIKELGPVVRKVDSDFSTRLKSAFKFNKTKYTLAKL